MARYRIDPDSDRQYVEEFRRNPVGRHSPGLMRVLSSLRRDPTGKQIILFCRKPFAEWQLAEMPANREDPIVFLDGPVFNDRNAAEWDVFCRRWHAATGERINMHLGSSAGE